MLDLNEIRKRNETWRRGVELCGVCQECGAGQDGYASPADIDALIAEIRRLDEELENAKDIIGDSI